MTISCSVGSRLRPRSGDGTAESHAEAWGEDTDWRQALAECAVDKEKWLHCQC